MSRHFKSFLFIFYFSLKYIFFIFSTPLHISIQSDNKLLFRQLISNSQVDVNIRSLSQHPPLYYALLKYEAGDVEDDSYAKGLLNNNARTDVVYGETGNSLLQLLLIGKNIFGCAKVFLVFSQFLYSLNWPSFTCVYCMSDVEHQETEAYQNICRIRGGGIIGIAYESVW